jgi:hypothetical protein
MAFHISSEISFWTVAFSSKFFVIVILRCVGFICLNLAMRVPRTLAGLPNIFPAIFLPALLKVDANVVVYVHERLFHESDVSYR